MLTPPDHTHLPPNGGDFVPVPGQQSPDPLQLLSAVPDVPDLIVKVSARKGSPMKHTFYQHLNTVLY